MNSQHLYPLYCDLFSFYMDDFNWLYATRFSEMHQFIQSSSIFLLYVLKEKASGYISQQDFAVFYLKAFPGYLDEMNIKSPYLEDDFTLSQLFFEKFCILFGLSEFCIQDEDEKSNFKKKDYKQSALFRKLFDWKI